MPRYLENQIHKDLAKKMVFLGGPRQIGKTTLAKSLLTNANGYLNWDAADHRERILQRELPKSRLWVFDEIHKYRQWRNYLKGLYDTKSATQQILVTGSARLDYYRRGGDSLQGRYHFLRMHPLSVVELGLATGRDLGELLKLGGFPEPYFSASEIESKRWSREYRTRLIREDLLSLETVHDLGSLELLMLRLPALVGSPLSINALREDLQLGHKTVAHWLDILDRLYAIFRVSPFGAPKIRAVKKEQKHYHFDWTLLRDNGPRFENLVACHLLKWVNFKEDTEGRDLELRYFRDTDKREVDFVVVEDRAPVLFVECKYGDDEVSPALRYLKHKFAEVEAWQISAVGNKDYVTPDDIRVAPAMQLLKTLV
jgi:predicted AAA+ superfamily ATPase